MNIPIWPGSSSFSTYLSSSGNPTPFGFFDNDTTFQQDADKVAKWCAQRMGYPVMSVELQDINFWTAFEEATNEYSRLVNQYAIKNNLLSVKGLTIQGTVSDISLSQTLINPNLGRIISIAENYGTEAGSGGNVTWKRGHIDVTPGTQDYDLNTLWANVSESSNRIEIKRVFHEGPPAIVRYFDPYIGTGLGTQQMLESFGWGNYSPGVNFMMMPVFQDLLRIQAIELNDQIRKSAYTFEISNNRIRIFPIPTYALTVYFDYIVENDRLAQPGLLLTGSVYSGSGALTNAPSGSFTVSGFSNAPYNKIMYSTINDVGRQWIWQYALAISKEMLGLVRNKYQTIPIPDSELTLNGSDLINQAAQEKQSLVDKLNELLQQMSPSQLMTQQLEEAKAMNEFLNNIPLPIWIG